MQRAEQGKSLDYSRKKVESQLTSRSTTQEQLTKQIASRQDTMQEPQISDKIVPVLLSFQGTKFEKFADFCSTLMARDFKGFGNQCMTGVIVVESRNK